MAENTGAGEAVGVPVAAKDAEDDALTYALGGPDAALFAIDEGTGQIRVGAGTTLDYEADKNAYDRRPSPPRTRPAPAPRSR